MTASSAATRGRPGAGRVYIGIGAGGTGVWHLGMKTAKPLDDLEEYVLTVPCALLAEGEAEYRGETVRLPWAAGRQHPDRRLRARARRPSRRPARSATASSSGWA